MATVHKNAMHGLSVFITDIRNCQSHEKEEKRVSKELAKIRKKFKENKDIDGYNRRKYVSKLVYSFMLGYEIDFGLMEAVTLLSSAKFQEKLTGYLAISLFIHENHEMIPLIIQALLTDLQSRTELHQILALTAIANIGGKEMAESLAPVVQKLLTAKSSKPLIKKKAALSLLRLWRRYPDIVTPDWAEKIISLLDETDHGVLLSVMSLLIAIAEKDPNTYEPASKKVINLLTKVVISRDFAQDYVYYGMPNPWLQVKALHFLNFFPPPEDRAVRQRLSEILRKILDMVDTAKGQTANHKNSLNAVLFEAIDLVVILDDDKELIKKAAGLLGRFISTAKETNIRYLGLKGMSKLARANPETAQLAKKYQETVIIALKDSDISIRKRALDLLYEMCDAKNVKVIVGELLNYLINADFGIREELVVKIAVLAEKFATHYSWYVDVILQLISLAGDFVGDDIWFRVVQIVTNHEDIQEYAAKTVLHALKQPNCHETAVKVGGYILGEFGELIAEKPESTPKIQYETLMGHFPNVSLPTRALLLSTFVKFVNLYSNELGDTIREVFRQYQRDFDAEVQQRACEYYKLTVGSQKLLQTVWEMMPHFANKTQLGSGVEEGEGGQSQGLTLSSSQSQSSSSQSQASSSKATKSSNLLDDLLDLSTPSQTVSSPAPVSSSSNSLDDIFGTSSSSSRGPSSNTADFSQGLSSNFGQSAFQQVPVVSPKAPDTPLSNSKINLADTGILYQDDNIQIGYKSEFTKGSGRLMLFYGNKTSSPISSFSSAVSQVPALSFNVQSISPTIDAKAQVSQLLNVTSVGPFSGSPNIAFNYVANGKPFSVTVPLPLVLCKFTEPNRLKGPEFFQFWNKVGANAPLEQQAIVKSPGALNMEWLTKLLGTGFHLAVLQGVDPNMNNVVCSGSFNTTNVQTPVAVRIETNPQAQMYRCTIRTTDAQVSVGFKDLLQSQLS